MFVVNYLEYLYIYIFLDIYFFEVFCHAQWDHLPPLRVPTVGGSSWDSNPGLDWVTQWTVALTN